MQTAAQNVQTVEIKNWWARAVIYSHTGPNATLRDAVQAAVDAGANLTGANLTDADLTRADLTRADLTGANLTRANLTRANLTRANLTRADLTRANLTRANLTGANLTDADLTRADLTGVPTIPNIHAAVFAAASVPGALDMSDWHCGTAHCRAGWVVTLAGAAGAAMEFCMGTPAAAAMIYLASDPGIDAMPDFYTGNAAALADMRERAEKEAAK